MSSFNKDNNYKTDEDMIFYMVQDARLDLIGELEAIIQYDNHIHEATNESLKETWKYIRDGELMHVGELLAALFYLAPYQKKLVELGFNRFIKRISEKKTDIKIF